MRSGRSREEECRARVEGAAGSKLSDEDYLALIEDIQARMRRRMAAGEPPDAAARGAGADAVEAAKLAALVEKRNRAKNILVRNDLDERTIEGDEYNSVQAAMGGSVRRGRFYGLSADAIGHSLVERNIGDLINELRRADLLRLVRRRDPLLDRQITEEMWHLESGGDRPQVSGIARQIAEIFHKHQEIMRLMLNQAGAWISKLEHYVVRQSHDMMKIRGDGSMNAFRAWRDYILPRLDSKTFDHILVRDVQPGAVPTEINGFLYDVWKALSSGLHDHSYGADWMGGFKGPGNLAKRLSQERVLHFKDPISWHEYNTRFGRGTTIDAVLHGIERGAHNTAVMRVFGTNPEKTISDWTNHLREVTRDRGDFKMSDRLGTKAIKQTTDIMTGLSNKPDSMSLAWYAQTFRNLQHLSKLGSAVLSSFNDIPTAVAALRHNGVPILEGYAHQLASLLPTNRLARKEVEVELGGFIHGLLGDMSSRLRAEDSRYGGLAQTTNLYFKLNGLNWWTDRMRVGTATGIAAKMAYYARGHEFEALPSLLRTTLDRYGIGAAEWRALSQVPTRAEGGGRFLMPADILSLPDEAVAGLGRTANAAREELRTRYGTMITDQTREAISEPTIRNRGTLTLHTIPGTWQGEAVRSVAQFKSFVGAFLARTLGRELFRGGTQIGPWSVDLGGIAHLMVATTVFGALSIAIKDLASGRNLRDLSDGWSKAKFAAAAMAQGGGLGIYGDYLFGGAYGTGRSAIESFAGPTAGTLADVQRMLGTLESGKGHLGAQAVQFGKSNAPFVNLFYTKAALDHLFFHGLQESVNPGYLRRLEQKSRTDYKQTYWLRPTEAVRF